MPTLTMFILLGRSLFNSFFLSPQRRKFLKAPVPLPDAPSVVLALLLASHSESNGRARSGRRQAHLCWGNQLCKPLSLQ